MSSEEEKSEKVESEVNLDEGKSENEEKVENEEVAVGGCICLMVCYSMFRDFCCCGICGNSDEEE